MSVPGWQVDPSDWMWMHLGRNGRQTQQCFIYNTHHLQIYRTAPVSMVLSGHFVESLVPSLPIGGSLGRFGRSEACGGILLQYL